MHCTYRVIWSPDDDEYVASCVEFPSLSWLDDDPVEALRGLCAIVADAIDEIKDAELNAIADARRDESIIGVTLGELSAEGQTLCSPRPRG